MLRRAIFLLLITVALGASIGFYTMAVIKTEVGDFTRSFPFASAFPFTAWRLPGNGYYPVGLSGDTVILGWRNRANAVFFLPPGEKSNLTERTIAGSFASNEVNVIEMHGEVLFLTAMRAHTTYWASRKDYIAHEIPCKKKSFIASVPVSCTASVIRTFFKHKRENVLALVTAADTVIYSPAILEKQIDGVFCTDGMLIRNWQRNSILYLYYYRNQYMETDTALHLLYRANTIDTTTHAAIKVTGLASDKTLTLDSPPRIVNAYSATSGDFLFVNSTIIGRGEELKRFKENSVIDVYDLRNRRYSLSFYVPDYEGIKMKSFYVLGGRFYVVYKDLLICYRIPGLPSELS